MPSKAIRQSRIGHANQKPRACVRRALLLRRGAAALLQMRPRRCAPGTSGATPRQIPTEPPAHRTENARRGRVRHGTRRKDTAARERTPLGEQAAGRGGGAGRGGARGVTHVARDVLHGVVDRHARGDGAARGVDCAQRTPGQRRGRTERAPGGRIPRCPGATRRQGGGSDRLQASNGGAGPGQAGEVDWAGEWETGR